MNAAQHSLIFGQGRLHLIQLSLVQTRINHKQRIPFFYEVAFFEKDFCQFATHL